MHQFWDSLYINKLLDCLRKVLCEILISLMWKFGAIWKCLRRITFQPHFRDFAWSITSCETIVVLFSVQLIQIDVSCVNIYRFKSVNGDINQFLSMQNSKKKLVCYPCYAFSRHVLNHICNWSVWITIHCCQYILVSIHLTI